MERERGEGEGCEGTVRITKRGNGAGAPCSGAGSLGVGESNPNVIDARRNLAGVCRR